jgi:hypothetical protein
MIATIEAKLIAGVIGFILIGGILFGAYHYGRTTQKVQDALVAAKLQLAEDALIQDAQAKNEALKTTLEVKHEQANDALNYLLDHPAQRVLLPSTCPGQAIAAGGSAVQAPGSQPAGDIAQSALDDFVKGMESDAAEYSRALNACQVVMTWAKHQGNQLGV